MMRLALALLVFLGIATPAQAERLTFDHRFVPELKAVLDSNRAELIDYNAKNPRYVVDRIVVRGTSLDEWTELFEIIARTPDRKVRRADEWMAELQARDGCQASPTIVVQDDNSLTAERRPGDCSAKAMPRILYRVVAGKRSLFLLAVHERRTMTPAERQQWLDLLASARLE